GITLSNLFAINGFSRAAQWKSASLIPWAQSIAQGRFDSRVARRRGGRCIMNIIEKGLKRGIFRPFVELSRGMGDGAIISQPSPLSIKIKQSAPSDGQLCFRCHREMPKVKMSVLDLRTLETDGGGLCRDCIEHFRCWLAAGRIAAMEGES